MSLALNFRGSHTYNVDEFALTSKKYSTIESTAQEEDSTWFVALKSSSPYSFTPLMLRELLDCARRIPARTETGMRFRALVSKRRGVFSLGGDLAFFRRCIEQEDVDGLTGYAKLAVDLIWESVTASEIAGMTSVALVEGEAQGGGFEAALAAHILIAERGTWFGFPEGLFGLFPGMGARALLSARGAGAEAGKLIGSARRYQAEELYSMGIIDFLAEPGRGMQVVKSIGTQVSPGQLEQFRRRFSKISKAGLMDSVSEWVDLAMRLSQKHLRTIDFLIKAQETARSKSPGIRVI